MAFWRSWTFMLSFSLLLLGGQNDAQNIEEIPLCFEFNRVYVGFPLGNHREGCTSALDCQSLCQEDAGCNWFNWNSLSKRCFMETKKGRPKDLPGTNITTGSKYCSDISSCYETDKTYIGYPMNSTGQGAYVDDCPSPHHCQELCQKEKKCEWFSWLNLTSSDPVNMVPRCYLKMGKGKAIPLSGVTTGPKYCQPERSCIERGKMYIGDGLNVWKRRTNNFGRQKSEAACQDLCKRSKDCEWFNWNKDSKCWLKRSHGQKKTPRQKQIMSNGRLEPGVSTGPRECPRIPVDQNCDEGWEYSDGSCYFLNLNRTSGKKYSTSIEHCTLLEGASLVSLQTIGEITFVTEMLNRNYFQWKDITIWVDALRASDADGYAWQDENRSGLQDDMWKSGEPRSGKQCLQLVRDDNDSWVFEAVVCEEQKDTDSFICEKTAYKWNTEVYDFPVNEEEERSGENDDNETTDAPTEVTTQPTAIGYACTSGSSCLVFIDRNNILELPSFTPVDYTKCNVPEYPNPDSRAVSVVVDGHIMTCGGYDQGDQTYPRTSDCYALIGGVWTQQASMGDAVHSSAISETTKGPLRSGGQDEDDTTSVSTTEYFQSGEWVRGPDLPDTLWGHCQVTIGSTVYIAGGHYGPERIVGKQTFSLDVETGTWTRLADMRTKKRHSGCIVFEGNMWMLGGYTDIVEYYDPTTNTWYDGPTLPRTGLYGLVVEWSNTLYYFEKWTKKVLQMKNDRTDWDEIADYTPSNNKNRHHWIQPALVDPELINC